MLSPKKVKHRKQHRPNPKGRATAGIELSFGSFGLKAMESGWLSSRQIEAARRAMTRSIMRGGKIWIRVFPDRPITFHGNEAVMGSGKGSPEYFVASVPRGKILFEMEGVTQTAAAEAMRLAAHKLPVKSKFITKESE